MIPVVRDRDRIAVVGRPESKIIGEVEHVADVRGVAGLGRCRARAVHGDATAASWRSHHVDFNPLNK